LGPRAAIRSRIENWEGTGLSPDVTVTAKDALQAAEAGILRDFLAGETNPEARQRINACLAELK